MAQKAKKKSKMRHAEYYDMQKTFDDLYAASKNGETFGHLMEIISAPNNIKLAFRNIKGNDGSHTAGTDGRTIESLAAMPEDMHSHRQTPCPQSYILELYNTGLHPKIPGLSSLRQGCQNVE